MRSGRVRADQYGWQLTADPPVCRDGPALGILRRCELLRRGERCFCRFAAADLAEDLAAAGAPELGEYFDTALEPEEVEVLAERLGRLELGTIADEDLSDRLRLLRLDLERLARAGSGLTDRFADDLD